jgi:hypothetical protein
MASLSRKFSDSNSGDRVALKRREELDKSLSRVQLSPELESENFLDKEAM